jgi:hypothetical protein
MNEPLDFITLPTGVHLEFVDGEPHQPVVWTFNSLMVGRRLSEPDEPGSVGSAWYDGDEFRFDSSTGLLLSACLRLPETDLVDETAPILGALQYERRVHVRLRELKPFTVPHLRYRTYDSQLTSIAWFDIGAPRVDRRVRIADDLELLCWGREYRGMLLHDPARRFIADTPGAAPPPSDHVTDAACQLLARALALTSEDSLDQLSDGNLEIQDTMRLLLSDAQSLFPNSIAHSVASKIHDLLEDASYTSSRSD